MMNTLDLMIALDDLRDPAPIEEEFEETEVGPGGTQYVHGVHEGAYHAALTEWRGERQERVHHRCQQAEYGQLPEDKEEAIEQALIAATTAVQKAEDTRSELIGIAVHESNLSVRRVSALTGLHSNTVAKRASEGVALNALIALKKAELDALMTKSKTATEAKTAEVDAED